MLKIKDTICQGSSTQSLTQRLINEEYLMTFSVQKENRQYNFVLMMDGSTGLGPEYEIELGYTAAEWYVEKLATFIKQILITLFWE